MSELTAVDSSEVVSYPPLTVEEDSFALAIIEYGGNIGEAYRSVFGGKVSAPAARGKLLLQQPNIALRIRDISSAVHEDTLISLASHLDELSQIRDLAKLTGQIKVAYSAERSRGEAVGIYQRHDQKSGGPTVAVQVNFASPHDAGI